MQNETCQIFVSLADISGLVFLLLIENYLQTNALKMKKVICLPSSNFCSYKAYKTKILIKEKGNICVCRNFISTSTYPSPGTELPRFSV